MLTLWSHFCAIESSINRYAPFPNYFVPHAPDQLLLPALLAFSVLLNLRSQYYSPTQDATLPRGIIETLPSKPLARALTTLSSYPATPFGQGRSLEMPRTRICGFSHCTREDVGVRPYSSHTPWG